MRITRTKLFQDKYFEVRSYELDNLKKGEKLFCFYNDRVMTLTPELIKSQRLQLIKIEYASKVNAGQVYSLYDYLWKPDQVKTEEEKLQELSKLCL
jgi:hypothetical protein